MLNHLDHIIWQINCANLWLFSRKIQGVAVPKETSKFSESSPIIFCRFSQKRSLGSVLFSRDGRVITNKLLFLALLECAKGELYFPLKNNHLIPMISTCSENSQHPWQSHFNIEFSWQCNFSGKTAFKIVSHFSAHYQRNGLF